MNRTTFQFLATLLLSVSLTNSFAQPLSYKISPMDSRIGFVVTKWLVFKEEGRFKQFDGTIVFDATNPATTQVSISIQTGSVDSRNTDRDQVIRANDMLDSNRFPAMIFKSTSVQAKGRDTLMVTGDFTIRNITRRITVPVRSLGTTSARGVGSLVGFEAAFAINRFDYGVSAYENLISKDVEIQMQIGAIAKP